MDADDYILWLLSRGYTEDTIRGYIGIARLWVQWCEGHRLAPAKASRKDAAEWVLERRQLSPSTMRNTLIGLRAYYRFLRDSGRRRDDPTQGLKAPKVSLPPIKPYEIEELRALLSASHRPRDRAMLLLLIDGGLRSSELLRIREDDINWQDGTLRIRGKGNKTRQIAPGQKAMEALRLFLASQPDNIWREGIGTTSGLRRWLRRLADRAGVSPANLHRFRHTYAAGFLRDGGSEGQLQRILGHSSLAMSFHYAEAARDQDAQDAQRRLSQGDRL